VDLDTTLGNSFIGVTCYVDPGTLGIIVALIIMIGTTLSYVPQYIIILRNKSSEGLNLIMLSIAMFSTYLTATNSGILKWPLATCCQNIAFGRCLLNNLATEQLIVSVFCVFTLYLLAVIYYPPPVYAKPVHPWIEYFQRRKTSWIIFGIINSIGILCSVLAGILYYNFHYSSSTIVTYGKVLGYTSSVGIIIQWSPQIFTTFKNKSGGNLSLVMLCVQMPGALLVVFFQGILNKADFSTWFPYIFTAIELTILIILVVVFWIRDKARGKVDEVESTEDTPLIPRRYDVNNSSNSLSGDHIPSPLANRKHTVLS